MEHCPNCGGELKIIAAILEQPVIEKILTHLVLQARTRHGDAAPIPSQLAHHRRACSAARRCRRQR
jgi:hypothetical protein